LVAVASLATLVASRFYEQRPGCSAFRRDWELSRCAQRI